MKKILTAFCILFSLTGAAQNVGIGETNPTAMKLQVKTSDSAVALLQNSTTSGTNVKTGLFFKTGGNYSGSIATIGSGATFRMGLFTYGDPGPSGLIERISISDGGNVGIGKTIPLEKLDVAGDLKADTILPTAIRMTPNAGDGKVLTSDAAGNATWQEKSSNGSAGFGTWGDCSTNNISEYFPIADTTSQSNSSYFGKEVSMSGSYAIVGAPSDKIGANLRQGSANIYQFGNGVWTLTQKIIDANGLAGDDFGSSVAIIGNYALIGSPGRKVGANTNQGSVSVYVLSGGNWVFSQRLTDPSGNGSDYFGSSVAISGNYVVVGAPRYENVKGNACVYQLLLGSFIFMQNIYDATGIPGDAYGSSVSISGNNIIVGSPGFGFSANGVSNIYKLSGSWVLANKFTGVTNGDKYGARVSISGSVAIVGRSNAKNIVQNQTYFGVGSVITYHLVNNSWVRVSDLPSSEPTSSSYFGENLFLSGNYAIIAYQGNNSLSKVTIYQRIGFTWQKVQDITNPLSNTPQTNIFGSAVAIDAGTKRFLISSVCNYSISTCNGFAIFGKLNF